MLKYFTLLFFLASISSCTSEYKGANQVSLHQEIGRLNARIDSLVAVISLQQQDGEVVTQIKKKSKKRTQSSPKQYQAASLYSPSSGNNDNYRSSNQSSSSYHCQATTKKGNQCSRKARSGGYCWQHGG